MQTEFECILAVYSKNQGLNIEEFQKCYKMFFARLDEFEKAYPQENIMIEIFRKARKQHEHPESNTI